MVKYNLFLWYHDIPALREEVFSDPQIILRIITDLVQCKLELAGDDVPQLLSGKGVKNDWCVKFRDHVISLKHFKQHFVDGVFAIEHFTNLMCKRFIMVPIEWHWRLLDASLPASCKSRQDVYGTGTC